MPQLAPLEQLSDLQRKILKHIVECTEVNESVSHISRELNTLQPAVFRSIKSLIEEEYVKKEGDYTYGNKKLLSLTEKGAAVAFLLADKHQDYLEKFNEILKEKLNERYQRSLQQLVYLLKEEPNNRESITNKAMKYWLKNNLFQGDKIDRNKWTYFILKMVSESNSALRQPKSIKKFIEKYGLDKKIIINALEDRRKAINLLISELGGLDQAEQPAPADRRE